ncbi:FAD dependent oxidoreductase [Tilletiopsis washingtonensis]|uniref:FAD dependent oxidoreductase n=1 Tax=Tilletiopsis washingtonensis TaxID=58919 RepID=A0A316Z926_9BASI|nr:FAD dependent oxidoreductase [Tilletiopsis washingtonensis]PWN97766.1 FAD dependent oxidoreductase [Tilletiopsis washingtonensis]
MPTATTEQHDVLIIGAGLSGINAAYRVQTETKRDYTILEGRASMGGTWDLFRYPGIRSDSDMNTFSLPFRVWRDAKSLADGPAILDYIKTTAAEFGIDRHIRYNTKVKALSWDSSTSRWTVTVETNGQTQQLVARWVLSASGYYRYDAGYLPEFPGRASFKGPVVHPQAWPEDLDYKDKRVAVIGSGATAITLVPAMLERGAAHMTMIQRSPSYYMMLNREDTFSRVVRNTLPEGFAHTLLRFLYAARTLLFFFACQAFPKFFRGVLQGMAAKQLPKSIPVDPHFTPSYNPWDQRLCVAPGGDLFECLRSGKADMVTGHIEHFTDKGILMKDGQHVNADIIVTATGLQMELLSDITITVDGELVKLGERYAWQGQLLEGVPNLSIIIGYSNLSWTCGSDVCARMVCKLINEQDKTGKDVTVPEADRTQLQPKQIMSLSSGYFQRAKGRIPMAGNKAPWAPRENYFRDLFALYFGSTRDSLRSYASGTARPVSAAAKKTQ